MKLILKLGLLAWKQVTRHRLRSLLTIAGVGVGMFLYTAVETLQFSLRQATHSKAQETTLVVYRENRFCPMTSRLPEYYLTDIRKIPGVVEVIPIQIRVNNCGASLDVITFRGVPPGTLLDYNPDLEIVAGNSEDWTRRDDAALVGHHFAARRGLQPGDQFEAVGIRVEVAAIIRSPHAQDNNVAYVHLPFLQQASRVGLGTVTQFNVKVESPDLLEPVANQIDERFAADSAPTNTRPEMAFMAQTAQDLIEMIAFTRILGVGAVFAVMGLVANALLLIARARIQENAIYRTLGYSRRSIFSLMLWEGAILGLIGGFIGSLSATLFFHLQRFTLGNEGLTLAITPSLQVAAWGLALALLLGLLASLWPATVSSTQPIVSSLRRA